jgi:glycine cleavage system H protein
MSELPKNLKYATTHEWVKVEDGNIVQIGITDFAQQELGDLVYIDLPKLGRKVSVREQCAIVESVKTASDLFSPVAGEIIAINETAADEPEQVNDKPYQTWLFRIQADDLAELDQLLDADAYQQFINQ